MANDSSAVCNVPSDSKTATYTKVGSILMIGTIAILGNSFIILVALKYTIRRNLTYLITNMAVADILVSVMGYFFEAAPFLNLKYFFANSNIAIIDNIMCRLFTFIKHSSRLVTLSNLLIISIERFKATSPASIQIRRPYTMKRLLVIIGSSWGIPMLLCGFGLFATIKKRNQSNFCNVSGLNTWRNVGNCAAVITFLVILTLTLTSLKRLKMPQAILAHIPAEQARTRVRRTSRAVKMVLFSLLLYTTYYPLFFYKIVYILILGRQRKVREGVCINWEVFTFMIRFLPLVNSSLSPFVYLAFLKDYQEGAQKCFCGWFTRRPKQNEVQTTEMTRVDIRNRNTSHVGNTNLGHDFEEAS